MHTFSFFFKLLSYFVFTHSPWSYEFKALTCRVHTNRGIYQYIDVFHTRESKFFMWWINAWKLRSLLLFHFLFVMVLKAAALKPNPLQRFTWIWLEKRNSRYIRIDFFKTTPEHLLTWPFLSITLSEREKKNWKNRTQDSSVIYLSILYQYSTQVEEEKPLKMPSLVLTKVEKLKFRLLYFPQSPERRGWYIWYTQHTALSAVTCVSVVYL